MLRLRKLYTLIVEVIVSLLLITMILSLTYGILSRNFSLLPLVIWTEELARFCMIFMVFIVAGLSVRHGMHLGVDLLVNKLPKKWNRIVTSLTNVTIMIVLSIVALETFNYAQVAGFRSSHAMKIPMSIPYMIIAVGLFFIIVELLVLTIKKWKED